MLAGKRFGRSARWSPAALLLLAACGGGGGDAAPVSTSTAPSTTAEPAPSTTAPPSTTERPTTTEVPAPATTLPPASTVPAVTPGEDPPALLPDDLPCEPAWQERDGDEVTFARGRDVFTFRPPTGEVVCIARLDREPSDLSWSPDGSTLLVDSDLLVDAGGSRPSGFTAGTPGIRWSKPNGLALIAPSADGAELVHIDVGDPGSARDVGALAQVWSADYHPSGEAIVSAGVDADGRRGLFLSDNDGEQLTQLVTLDDPDDTIPDVAFGYDGGFVDFVHDHAGGDENGAVAHVHRFDLLGVFVTDIATPPEVPNRFTTSRQVDGSVAYTVDISTASSWTEVTNAAASPHTVRLPDWRFDPVGFVDDGSLVGVARPVGDSTSTGSLRVVAPDGDATVVARGVTAAAVRVQPHPTWQVPPVGVILQAVG